MLLLNDLICDLNELLGHENPTDHPQQKTKKHFLFLLFMPAAELISLPTNCLRAAAIASTFSAGEHLGAFGERRFLPIGVVIARFGDGRVRNG